MASRAPKPPSGGVSNATPPPGARKVVRRRSGGKHFERTIREPTREELHRGPSREELPKEVQEMPKSDTVCKFCGVSYLVFSEIKDLEKRLIASEDKIAEYTNRLRQFDEMKAALAKMAESRGQQQNQLDILEDEWSSRCNVLQAKVDMLQEDNRLKRHTANKLQDRMKKQVKRLALVRQALKKEKNALLGMRANTDTVMKDMGSVIKSTLHEVEVMAVRLKQETQARKDGDHLRKTLKAQLEVLEKEWMNDVARLEEKLRQQAKQINDARDEEVKKMEENHRGLQENLEKQVQEEVNKNKELHDRADFLGG